MAFYMDWSSFDPTVSPKNNFLTDKIADKAGQSEFYLKRFLKVAMVDYLVVNQVQGMKNWQQFVFDFRLRYLLPFTERFIFCQKSIDKLS